MTAALLGEADFRAALQALLPRGAAWPRHEDAVLTRFLGALAARHAALHARTGDLSERESFPPLTAELIGDWERALGLPDECSAELTLLEQRRAAVVARLTERLAPTPAAIEAVSLAFGVRVSVVEFGFYNCEMDCEQPITDEAWAHAFQVWGSGRVVTDATCEDDCEQPLRAWSTLPHECAVRRLAPAHTVPLFGSFTDEWSFLGGLPAGATFTRPAPADRIDNIGATETMGVDVPRLGYQAGLEFNVAPNPWLDGAAPGVPGTDPIGWSGSGHANGVTREILGTGVEGGVPCLYVAWSGTPTSVPMWLDMFTGINPSGLAGQTKSAAGFLRLVEGVAPAQMQVRIIESEPGAESASVSALSPALTQHMHTRLLTGGSTANWRAVFRMFLTAAVPINCVVAYGFPTMNDGASPITDRVPLAILAARIGPVPQYGLLGLMLEAGAGEELRLAVPEGLYTAQMVGATPSGAITTYHQPLLASVGGSLRVQWPAAAIADGANHLRSLILRKVL